MYINIVFFIELKQINESFSGAMAGLAFGMIVLGILITAAIYVALVKMKKIPDNMAVGFVKDSDA